jgi:hypothetical protein
VPTISIAGNSSPESNNPISIGGNSFRACCKATKAVSFLGYTDEHNPTLM